MCHFKNTHKFQIHDGFHEPLEAIFETLWAPPFFWSCQFQKRDYTPEVPHRRRPLSTSSLLPSVQYVIDYYDVNKENCKAVTQYPMCVVRTLLGDRFCPAVTHCAKYNFFSMQNIAALLQ